MFKWFKRWRLHRAAQIMRRAEIDRNRKRAGKHD